MKFEEYMENKIPGYKELIPEEVIITLRKDFDTMDAYRRAREMAMDMKLGQRPNWGEGWEQVQRAIRRYGSYEQQKALDSMDEVTRQAVQQMGWKNICLSDNETADRANFRMIYERLAERRRQDAQLPEALRQRIGNMNIGMIERGDGYETGEADYNGTESY